MDELAKTEARNYLSAAGFFVLGALYLLFVFAGQTSHLVPQVSQAVGFGLLLIGILLLVLRKRDMIAMLFIIFSAICITNGFIEGHMGEIFVLCTNGLLLLTVLVTLTGKDKAKWMLISIPLLLVISSLADILGGTGPGISSAVLIIFAAVAVVSMYFAFCCACERVHLPGSKLLTADEQTDFKASGSALGYLLFATTVGGYAVYYIAGESLLRLELLHTANLVSGCMLLLVGVLLLTIAKMRFTPVMFIAAGLVDILAMFSPGSLFIGFGILVIIIGLFAILRKESRIMPGIMFIVYGFSAFFTAYAGGSTPVVSVILNGIPCLIAIYLAFVVYSQKKLPKF